MKKDPLEEGRRKGKRLGLNKVKVLQQKKTGQFMITIPKAIATAYGLKKGKIITFNFNSKGKLEIVKK